jgi:hypothetical protein
MHLPGFGFRGSGTDAMRSQEAAGHLGGNLAWFSISGEDRSYRHRAGFCPANHMGENRSGDGRGRIYFCALGHRAGVCFSETCCRDKYRRVRRRRLGDPNSTLLPHTDAARSISPSAYFVIANCDFCGSLKFDCLGRHFGARCGQ